MLKSRRSTQQRTDSRATDGILGGRRSERRRKKLRHRVFSKFKFGKYLRRRVPRMLDLVVRLRDEAGHDAQVRAIDIEEHADRHADRKDQGEFRRDVAGALFTALFTAVGAAGAAGGTAGTACAAVVAIAAAERGAPDEPVVARLRHNTVVPHYQPSRRRGRVSRT